MAQQKQFRVVINYRGLDGIPDGVEKIFDASGMSDARKTAKRLAEELDGRVFCLDEMTPDLRAWLDSESEGRANAPEKAA